MSNEITEFRDIHYMDSRFKSQKKQFQKDTSKTNFEDWNVYEAWLIGHGRKLSTVLKQLGAFKRILRFFPSDNIKDLTKNQIIEINYRIVSSKYATTTTIGMQLFIRSYLQAFTETKERKDMINETIKILPEPQEDNPDSDEDKKTISQEDFKKILRNMPNEEMRMMVKVLFATGMRITEIYNIIPEKIQFLKKKLWKLTLPPEIFGYKGAWIYTKGKRTNHRRDGKYLYFMAFYVDDLKKYADKFNKNVYIFNFSYSYFLQKLHETAEKENLDYVVHPHLFRHTVATKLFKTHSEQTVKKILNWSKNSNMPQKYSHLKKSDVVDAMDVMKKNGWK